jgi:hypothetical protein
MKAGRPKLWWKILILVIFVVVIAVVLLLRPDNRGPKLVAETFQSLKQEGFKTDLAEFNFSTSAELQHRETALRGRIASIQRDIGPNLMETVTSNSAVVVWKGDSVRSGTSRWPSLSDEMTWDEFRQLQTPAIDAACEAALAGPIRFNLIASNGNFMLLPHLAILRNLTGILGCHAMLNLHDGNKDAAWTNIMAATRLVTAWEIEPVEVSYLVRFADTKEVFNMTWQTLQTDGWSDMQLARLQQEWDGVNFFTNLPEIAAFRRACDADSAVRDRDQMLKSRPSFFRFALQLLQSPKYISVSLRAHSNESDYLHHGWYEDQKDLLLYNRDWEVELRKAVQLPTWQQMRRLSGARSKFPFQSRFQHSIMQMRLNNRQLSLAFEGRGGGLLGHAAEAEAERRILLTAFALERYRLKHGSYPSTLAPLAPEFLKTVPVDFMDGQPLRYRLRDDGRFLLYSIGLDGVDDGGRIVSQAKPGDADFRPADFNGIPTGDIVWPFPASTVAVNARRQQELAIVRSRTEEADDIQSRHQWGRTARHQADVEKLLAALPANPPDSDFHGHPISQVLCNTNSTGTNRLTLGQMLTLKQVITGAEPETVTFQLPINYDVMTNLGELRLFIDTNNDDSDDGCNVQQLECDRATNGDCLLVWSTLYESPGKHALQAGLLLKESMSEIDGSLMPFAITNLCQFSIACAQFDPQIGATFRAKLPEANGNYMAQLTTTNGTVLKTFTGSTTNGVFNFLWDLVDDHGRRCTDPSFNSVFHITLPDSGRSQVLRGP